VEAELKFQGGSPHHYSTQTLPKLHLRLGRIDGTGTDDSGKFTINGQYNAAAPFGVKFIKTMSGTSEALTFDGFHSSDGGVFGNWEGAGGRGEFHLKRKEPKPEEIAARRQAEKDQLKTQLLSMGYSDLLCENALEAATSLEEAIEWCTHNADRIAELGASPLQEFVRLVAVLIGGRLSTETAMRQTGPPEALIKQLIEMGIPRDLAIEALSVNVRSQTQPPSTLCAHTTSSGK